MFVRRRGGGVNGCRIMGESWGKNGEGKKVATGKKVSSSGGRTPPLPEPPIYTDTAPDNDKDNDDEDPPPPPPPPPLPHNLSHQRGDRGRGCTRMSMANSDEETRGKRAVRWLPSKAPIHLQYQDKHQHQHHRGHRRRQ